MYIYLYIFGRGSQQILLPAIPKYYFLKPILTELNEI